MVYYLSVFSGIRIVRQGNFAGPFVSFIILFVECYYDFCRVEHLGIQFLLVSTYIRI